MKNKKDSIKVVHRDWWNPWSWSRARRAQPFLPWYRDQHSEEIKARWKDDGWRRSIGRIEDDPTQ